MGCPKMKLGAQKGKKGCCERGVGVVDSVVKDCGEVEVDWVSRGWKVPKRKDLKRRGGGGVEVRKEN